MTNQAQISKVPTAPQKITNVPFSSVKPQHNQPAASAKGFGPLRRSPSEASEPRPKRKEINLSELKKALEKSLEHKDQAPNQNDQPNPKPKTEPETGKGIINPGQKVDL